MEKEKFIDLYGYFMVEVNSPFSELGDYRLKCPDDTPKAMDYHRKGYVIGSIFKEDDKEVIKLDNDCGYQYNKVGYVILDHRKP